MLSSGTRITGLIENVHILSHYKCSTIVIHLVSGEKVLSRNIQDRHCTLQKFLIVGCLLDSERLGFNGHRSLKIKINNGNTSLEECLDFLIKKGIQVLNIYSSPYSSCDYRIIINVKQMEVMYYRMILEGLASMVEELKIIGEYLGCYMPFK